MLHVCPTVLVYDEVMLDFLNQPWLSWGADEPGGLRPGAAGCASAKTAGRSPAGARQKGVGRSCVGELKPFWAYVICMYIPAKPLLQKLLTQTKIVNNFRSTSGILGVGQELAFRPVRRRSDPFRSIAWIGEVRACEVDPLHSFRAAWAASM